MSRRKTRARNDLVDLAAFIRRISPLANVQEESIRGRVASGIERYILPRLGNEKMPLVVSFIGSTGAGKSTLVNSLARRVVSKAGVLRPTTKSTTVWTSAANRDALEVLGEVVEDDHPLLNSLALVDTPDLDSNVAGHLQEAMAVAESSDAVVFVTTAARYGDAVPWNVLSDLHNGKPVAVVLNRVPSRSGGARNDLIARLRRIGLGKIPVLSISEQRVDARTGLSRPSVQRLASLMIEWAANAGQHRRRTFDVVCDLLTADLARLLTAIEDRQRLESSLAQAMSARYRMALTEIEERLPVAPARRSRMAPGRDRTNIESFRRAAIHALDQATLEVGRLWTSSGVAVPAGFLRTGTEAASVIKQMLPAAESARKLNKAVVTDAARFLSLLARDPRETVTRLETGLATLSTLEWPDQEES